MQFYKKVLLTLTATVTMSGCAPKEYFQGVIVKQEDASFGKDYYLDIDGDTVADAKVIWWAGTNHMGVPDYAQIGDTIKYHTRYPQAIKFTNRNVDSVNNRSVNDLDRMYRVNVMRTGIGHPKQR